MRMILLLVAACATLACATAPRYPDVAGSAAPEIATAEQAIANAVSAGADSLAPEPLSAARENLERARVEQQANRESRAIIAARLARADAEHATLTARIRAAERARSRADAEVRAIPPGGRR
ncbi:MAG TPA: DUF4398 domain-containing protein [Gemmatimonadaceae bacterium]|nr:DUF4398 domain-containing protein [Gemmatimonadaceae bacterium]